jgi:hypothetical protein
MTNSVNETEIRHVQPSRISPVGQKLDEKNQAAIRNDQGLSVYIDPETGEFISPEEAGVQPDEKFTPPATYSTSTYQENLKEVPSPVSGGGMMVDLKGQFQSPLTATIDDHGNIKIEHKANAPKE